MRPRRALLVAVLLAGSWAILPAGTVAKEYSAAELPPLVDGNYTLSGDDSLWLTGDCVLDGNLVLRDNASLVVDGARLSLNGTLWTRENASAEFRNSTVMVDLPFPPPLPPNEVYESPNGFFLVGRGSRLEIAGCRMTFDRESRDVELPDGTMIAAESIVSFGSLNITRSRVETPLTVHLLTSSRTYVVESEVDNFGLEVDAFIDLRQTRFGGLNILDDRGGPSFMSNCEAQNVVAISRQTRLFMEFCAVDYLAVDGNATVVAFDCAIRVATASENARLELDRSLVTASDFPLPAALDNASVLLANGSRAAVFEMRGNARLELSGSGVDTLWGRGDSAATLKAGSALGNRTLRDRARVYQNSSVTVRTSLNGYPVDVPFEAESPVEGLSVAGRTGPSGRAELWLAERYWDQGGGNESGGYDVTVRFRSWTETRRVTPPAGGPAFFNFTDREPPAIAGLSARRDLLDGKEALTVTVTVSDTGYGVTNVTLLYSTGGSDWNSAPMSPLGDGRYAGTFRLEPGFGRREAGYQVVALDGAGNRAESGHRTYVTGQYDFLPVIVPLGLAVLAAAAGGWLLVRRRRRMDRYLGRSAARPPGREETGEHGR